MRSSIEWDTCPHSAYFEWLWLPRIAPSAAWAYRRLTEGLRRFSPMVSASSSAPSRPGSGSVALATTRRSCAACAWCGSAGAPARRAHAGRAPQGAAGHPAPTAAPPHQPPAHPSASGGKGRGDRAQGSRSRLNGPGRRPRPVEEQGAADRRHCPARRRTLTASRGGRFGARPFGAAPRERLGLRIGGDPMTNADKVRALRDQLAGPRGGLMDCDQWQLPRRRCTFPRLQDWRRCHIRTT